MVSLSEESVAERRIARLRRAVWVSGKLHELAGKAQPWIVTMTYALPDAWKPEHVSDAVRLFRKWCKKQGAGCRYTWVAEIQPKRLERTGHAVVHYHLIAWVPVGVVVPHWDEAGWWPHGHTNVEPCRTGIGYLMKYLSKLGRFHRFPKGARLYGVGGLSRDGRDIRAWYGLPEWAKRLHGVGELMRSAGRLVVRATGDALAPRYRVLRVPGGLELRNLLPVAERFADGPYSSLRWTP